MAFVGQDILHPANADLKFEHVRSGHGHEVLLCPLGGSWHQNARRYSGESCYCCGGTPRLFLSITPAETRARQSGQRLLTNLERALYMRISELLSLCATYASSGMS